MCVCVRERCVCECALHVARCSVCSMQTLQRGRTTFETYHLYFWKLFSLMILVRPLKTESRPAMNKSSCSKNDPAKHYIFSIELSKVIIRFKHKKITLK